MLGARVGPTGWLLSTGSRGPGKTQLVTIRIGHMKEPLAPLGIARRRVRPAASGDKPGIERVDLGLVEDHPPPPGPPPFGRLRDQVEKAGTGAEAGERRLFAAID